MNDWDDAFSNAAYIPDARRWPAAWNDAAAAFRGRARAELDLRYGPAPRNLLDLFLPEAAPRGLAVFVHGGYWLDFDKDSWSHLARGAVARGWAVAIPSYTLCPAIRIAGIAREIAAAIEHAAARIPGPVALSGHSAGGQLVARIASGTPLLARGVASRVRNIVAISGVHDLRPLMDTAMNTTLGIDDAEAAAESPALLPPPPGARVTAWVGAEERPEFRRQSSLLAAAWGASLVEEPGRHHFDVVEGLADPDHPLAAALTR